MERARARQGSEPGVVAQGDAAGQWPHWVVQRSLLAVLLEASVAKPGNVSPTRARGSTHVTSVFYGNYRPIPFIQAAILDRIAFEVQKAGVVPGLYVGAGPLDAAGYRHRGEGWTLRWDGGKNHGLWNCFNHLGDRIEEPQYMTTYEIVSMNLLDLPAAVALLLEGAEANIHTRRLEASRLLKHTQDIDFIDEPGCTMVEVPEDQFGPGDHWNDNLPAGADARDGLRGDA